MSICSYSKNPKTTTASTPTSNPNKKIRDDRQCSNFPPRGPPRKTYPEQKRSNPSTPNPRNWGSRRVGNPRNNRKYESYAPGGSYVNSEGNVKETPKKVSLNHLLNFKFEPRESEDALAATKHRFKRGGYRKNSSNSAFSKERFLQANCQFAVTEEGDYDVHFTDPDAPVPWEKIEQVFFKVENELSCPICLYPPSVAKITRCGHIYCWPCILHYLALDDKGHAMRDCPICGVDVRKRDLKSVSICEEIPLCIGGEVKMELMFRRTDSLTSQPIAELDNFVNDDKIVNGGKAKISKLSSVQVLDKVVEPELLELKRKLGEELEELEQEFVNSAITECDLRKTYLLKKISENIEENNSEDIATDNEPVENTESETTEEDAKNTTSEVPKQKSYNYENVHYFYQAEDRDHVFLNGLNTKCLLKEYGSFKTCPPTITGRLVHSESFVMTEDLRKRHKYLSHLPLSCEYKMVELDLKPPLISQKVLDEFQHHISRRAKNRQKKEREENDSRKRAEVEQQRKMREYLRNNVYRPSDSVVLANSTSTGSVSVFVTRNRANYDEEPATYHPNSATSSEYSTSPPLENSGPRSFAEMLKNGEVVAPRPKVRQPQLENTNMRVDTKMEQAEKSDDEVIDPEYVAPTYQSSFGDALSMALDALSVSTQNGGGASNEPPKGNRRQKKKKKQTLLFSTSAHMHP